MAGPGAVALKPYFVFPVLDEMVFVSVYISIDHAKDRMDA
jgi:hypothetical protein